MPSLSRFIHYKTNVPIIDEQHLELVHRIEDIKKAIKENNSDKVRDATLEFCAYMEYHLQYEEEFMSKFGYKYLDTHLMQHDTIKARLKKIKETKSLNSTFYDISNIERVLFDDIDHSDIQMCNEYIKWLANN